MLMQEGIDAGGCVSMHFVGLIRGISNHEFCLLPVASPAMRRLDT